VYKWRVSIRDGRSAASYSATAAPYAGGWMRLGGRGKQGVDWCNVGDVRRKRQQGSIGYKEESNNTVTGRKEGGLTRHSRTR